MAIVDKSRHMTVALAGNPNAGKTSLFNALTGSHYKVGNYPGVTVETREGNLEYRGWHMRLVDLPGTYSLTAYSLDEVVARDFVLDKRPDIILDVLDSSNLERNLYLLLQLIELGLPVAAALNMADEAAAKGITIDATRLSETLAVLMVPTVGSRGEGIEALLDAIIATVEEKRMPRMPTYGTDIETYISGISTLIASEPSFAVSYSPRWLAIKLTEKDPDAMKRVERHPRVHEILRTLEAAWHWIDLHYRKDPEIIMSEQRYGYIHGAVAEAVRRKPPRGISLTEQVDRILMHPLVGLPLFFFVIWGIFKLTFTLGEFPVSLLEYLFGVIEGIVQSSVPKGFLQDLLINGIIHGVGGVLSFVPLIVILFFCISILEDTGYIARAAFLTDRFLHSIGLHGQSFMPLMLGFGCSVPAIMATRTLRSQQDRIATILAIPFISCGAKLPVYVLLAGAFFPRNPTAVVMGIYAGGVVLSILSTYFLRRTVLKGSSMPFVMELPPYRLPTIKGVLWHVWEKTWGYLRKAGTVILAVSVLLWVITTVPKPPDILARAEAFRVELRTAEPHLTEATLAARVDTLLHEYRLEYSIAGRIGTFISPALKPIGFDWKIGVALIPGLAAKELVVSTLGVLYGAPVNEKGESASLRETLGHSPEWSPPIALALMVFVLVMPPCFASLATIRAEAGDKWMAFQVVYSIALAWLLSLVVSFFASAAGM